MKESESSAWNEGSKPSTAGRDAVPAVSVVIPVYNSGPVLRRMADSVLAQTFGDFELILIDDESPDAGTRELVDELGRSDARIRTVHQENRGAHSTRTRGIELARGKYVYFCDQDDWLHPQLLEYCIWVCEKHSVDFVAFCYRNMEKGAVLPEYDAPLGDFSAIPLNVADREKAAGDAASFRSAHVFHIICWAQFSTLELARKFPFFGDNVVSRPNAIMKNLKRWAVSDAVLYRYNCDQPTSILHQPLTEKLMLALRSDLRNLWELYRDERENGDKLGVWRQQCRFFFVKQIKVELNWLRRRGRAFPNEDQTEKYRMLAETLRTVFKEMRIPWRWFNFRHLASYFFIMLKYGK